MRQAGLRWCMPEYMISGDASNANYASTLVSESPFVRFIERLQGGACRDDVDIMWRVIDNAARAGRLSYDPEELRHLVKVQAEAAQVAVREKQQEHTVRREEHEAGVLSLRTWSEETGRDFEQEQARLAAEPKPEPQPSQAVRTYEAREDALAFSLLE